jgi:DNA-binding MarR family transcriptional regulator
MSSAVRRTPPLTIGSMLRSAWTELIDEVFEKLVAAGFDDLRPVHRSILRDVLTSSLRPSELGARLGLSKQAANDLVREFEAKGYITLEPDPDDGRAKRIVATERGWRASDTAQASSNAVGRRWAELVGDERYAVFEEVLREIVAANGAATRAPGSTDHPDR